ncbi:MAG TPA: SOS response-associated peptidase [Casimicrobiaceae bacterium]|nr:SOS response-associated peptidase [Casimicrobiaceae bacterium]
MCGRYELHTHPAALALAFGLAHPPPIGPRYNIAPMQDIPVVRLSRTGERELAQVRWGLVPRWAKDPSIGARMINARAETLAEKPAFRTSLRRHRCLVPADGFYEWKAVPGAGKQPYHIGMKDGAPFALAGLTERWLSADGETLDTCTIVTTQANALLDPLHDRMPLIIAPAEYGRWLDVRNDDVADLLSPYPSEAMAYYPVSTRVNAVRNDDAQVIERAAEIAPCAPPARAEAGQEHVPEQAKLF